MFKAFILGSLFLVSTAQANPFLECQKGDTEVLERAATLLVDVESLAKHGIVKRGELLRAQLFNYEAQHCAGKIDTQHFCQLAMPLLREWNAIEDTGLGNSSPLERKEKISLLAQGKILCEK